MPDPRSTWSKLRSWHHRDGKDKGKDRQPGDNLAIHGSRAARPTAHNQVLTAPADDAGAASVSPTPQTPEPVSQVQVPQKPPNDQAHEKLNQPKPYADNYDLWDEAYRSLEDEQRRDVEALLKDWDRDCPKRKDLAEDIQKTMDGALKSKYHDRTTSIGKLLSVLNKFLSAGDVAVSFDPAHAALPWAAVRCVIVIFTAHNELKGTLLTGMAEVTSLLVRCDMYQLLYMAPDPALRPPEDILAKLRTCIVQTYAGLQSFFAFVQEQETSFKISAVFKLENARAHIDKLSGSLKQLLQAADDCEKCCDLSSRSDLKELLGLSSEVPIIRQQVDLVLERIDAKEEREILEWISPIPYGSHHRVRVESRTPDTCEWLLQTEEFREWMEYRSSAILRLRGSMGAGKTYLTSRVIDHVQDLLASSSDHAGFAFFYCNRNDENRRDPLCVLQSYVRQLSTAVGSTEHIRKKLKMVSDQTRRQGSHLGFDACKTQLMESVNEYSQTVIILDALDECDQDSRWQLMEVMGDLISKSGRPLKVFISSRPDEDIKAQVSGKIIEIQAINNQGDIEKFVNAEIDKPRRWGPISADLRSEIVQVLCDGSQGMFQWAYLQIKQVLQLSTPAGIRFRLGTLPPTLEAAYEEIYGEIKKSPGRQALVDRACKWLMSAHPDFKSDEFLSAVLIDADGSSIFCEEQINESQLLDLCSNLLVVDPQTRLWRLSHLSVREYFERNHWGPREANSHAAKVCLKLLIEIHSSPTHQSEIEWPSHIQNIEPPNNLTRIHPFEEHVRYHWVIYVQAYEEQITEQGQKADSLLVDLLKRFLGSPSNSSVHYRAWYRSINRHYRLGFLENIGKQEISPETITVCTMCRFSLYLLLQDWWDNAEITVFQTNDDGESTLQLAARAGCKPICEKLIQRVTATHYMLPQYFYEGALVAAAGGGYLEIVKILIQNRADVNLPLPSGEYGSALAAAALKKEIQTVNYLIENGADVNLLLSSGEYGSALAAAAYRRHIEVVKFLVGNGADVNLLLSSGDFGSALAAAAAAIFGGDIEIVKFLVENGADVNLLLSSGNYGSALAAAAAAASFGDIETVKFLIDNGADVNVLLPSGDYGSALAAAAYRRHIEVVKFLVGNGADVNLLLSSGDFGSALAAATAAIFGGDIEIVKFLVENGADINLTLSGGKYGSALAAAHSKGNTEIVKMLVDNGANTKLALLN